MRHHLNDLLSDDHQELPEFDFWYLFKNAPSYTERKLKIYVYPLIFLLVGLGIYGLAVKIIHFFQNDFEIGIAGLLTYLLPLGIGVFMWVGFARHGQKQKVLFNLNKKYSIDRKANENSPWEFNLDSTEALRNKLAELSRGDQFVPKAHFIFSQKVSEYTIQIGDFQRTQLSRPNSAAYREELSFILILSEISFSKKKEVITDQTNIIKWFADKMEIDITELIQHKILIRVAQRSILIEFEKCISNPSKKEKLAVYLESLFKK